MTVNEQVEALRVELAATKVRLAEVTRELAEANARLDRATRCVEAQGKALTKARALTDEELWGQE